MNTTQAQTLQEIVPRLNDLNGDPLETHLEADYLLMDALVILKQSDIVSAFMNAKRRAKFDY